jgi:chromosome partitioning protein
MRKIAFINQKGGVGKTTTAVSVAAALARRGLRVLLVDLDPQGHASLHFGVEAAADDKTVYDVLTRGAALAEVARYVDQEVTVVPSHIDLAAAEVELAERDDRGRVLARALEPYADHYDLMIADCGPSLGLLTINALAAVDEVIIPLQPHFLALQGLGRLLETVTFVRDSLQPGLRVSGVVFCMCESATKLGQEVQADVESFIAAAPSGAAWAGATVFQTRIRRNIKLAECPSFGKTIFEYSAVSNGAEDYAALAAEIVPHAIARPPRKPRAAKPVERAETHEAPVAPAATETVAG